MIFVVMPRLSTDAESFGTNRRETVRAVAPRSVPSPGSYIVTCTAGSTSLSNDTREVRYIANALSRSHVFLIPPHLALENPIERLRHVHHRAYSVPTAFLVEPCCPVVA